MSTMYNDNHVDMLYNIDLYNIYRPVCHVDANGVLGCGLGVQFYALNGGFESCQDINYCIDFKFRMCVQN